MWRSAALGERLLRESRRRITGSASPADNPKTANTAGVQSSASNHEAYYTYFDDGTIDKIYADYTPNLGSYSGDLWNYTYDDAGRLTGEDREEYSSGSLSSTPLSQSYTFDAAGNRLTRTGSGTGYELMDDVATYTMYNDTHQLENYQLGAYTHLSRTYDDAGNTTRYWDNDGSAAFDWTYTWSEDNRMTLAHDTVGGTKIRYIYDWLGRRLERENETSSANGPKRRYYFHGLTPIYEATATRTWGDFGWGYWDWLAARYNTLAPGQYGHIVVQRDLATDSFLHYDHVGNVVAESNTSGVITETHVQDAFGRPVLSSAAGGWDNNSTHMTTKPWDDSTGMFYFFQRWYDQEIGAFHTVAPLRRDLESPCLITENRPLDRVDADGREVVTVCFIGVVGGGVVSGGIQFAAGISNAQTAGRACQEAKDEVRKIRGGGPTGNWDEWPEGQAVPPNWKPEVWALYNAAVAWQAEACGCAIVTIAVEVGKQVPMPGAGGPGPSASSSIVKGSRIHE